MFIHSPWWEKDRPRRWVCVAKGCPLKRDSHRTLEETAARLVEQVESLMAQVKELRETVDSHETFLCNR